MIDALALLFLLLMVLGAWSERVELYVDIALSYGLISFVGTLVLAKYFEATGGLDGESE